MQASKFILLTLFLVITHSLSAQTQTVMCESTLKNSFNRSDLLEMVRSPKCQIKTISDEEKPGLNQFLETHKNNDKSRYYWLNLKDVSANAQSTYPKNQIIFSLGERNLNFNAKLFTYNSLRVAKLVQQLPVYEKLKFAIWGASCECSNIKDFFPN